MDHVVTPGTDLTLGRAHSRRIERWLAGAVIVLPALGTVAAFALPMAHQAPLRDGAIFAVMYLVTGFGITVGYHRLFTHKGFEASPAVRAAFAIAGSMALQGPVIRWVADHRRHHAHSDVAGDPHSPVTHGFWHAHLGWLLGKERSRPSKYARDLLADKLIRRIDKQYVLWMVLTFALPFGMGFALGGTLEAALSALLWGGFARLFFVHHVTWAINSVCHVFGKRPYVSRDRSTNVAWLAIPSLGESWHNNHHAFPSSAVHGLDRFQPDPSAWLVRGLESLGLVRDVKVPSEATRARRVVGAADVDESVAQG